MPESVFSCTLNDQPSFAPIHGGTETKISMDIATASDVDTLLPLPPRDSTC